MLSKGIYVHIGVHTYRTHVQSIYISTLTHFVLFQLSRASASFHSSPVTELDFLDG